jgi:hypothetical protein
VSGFNREIITKKKKNVCFAELRHYVHIECVRYQLTFWRKISRPDQSKAKFSRLKVMSDLLCAMILTIASYLEGKYYLLFLFFSPYQNLVPKNAS